MRRGSYPALPADPSTGPAAPSRVPLSRVSAARGERALVRRTCPTHPAPALPVAEHPGQDQTWKNWS